MNPMVKKPRLDEPSEMEPKEDVATAVRKAKNVI